MNNTDEDLATKVFFVKPQTLYNWQKRYKEFFESIKRGKYDFDTGKVIKGLRRAATGYDYYEEIEELKKDPKTGKTSMQVVKRHTSIQRPWWSWPWQKEANQTVNNG